MDSTPLSKETIWKTGLKRKKNGMYLKENK
jgi:hypothetical protein